MTSAPTVISGLGRCGSSMVMQMLTLGGMKPTGDAVLPFLEDSRTQRLPNNPDWLKDLTSDHVIKILGPDRLKLPSWFRCKGIWLKRNTKEQVKSAIKYQAVRFGRAGFEDAELSKRMRTKTKKGIKNLKAITDNNYICMTFEKILEDPRAAANWLAQFINLPLDTKNMVSAVIKRSPKCLVDLPEINYARQQHGL